MHASPEPARLRLPERPCPVCGTSVEPLRAREVLLLEDGFRFLCSGECARRFREGERRREPPRRPTPSSRRARRDDTPLASDTTPAPSEIDPAVPVPWVGIGGAAAAVLLARVSTAHPVLGLLAVVAVAVASSAALVDAWPLREDLGVTTWALGPTGALLAGAAALLADGGSTRWWLLGAALAAGAVVLRGWLDGRARAASKAWVARLARELPAKARIPEGDPFAGGSTTVEIARLRAGEEVVVAEGEVVPVDGVVQAGQAEVVLHPSALAPASRVPGDPVVAGAQVIEGTLRILATRVGDDRALLRPRRFGRTGGSRPAPLARLAGRAARWGGPAALVVAGLALLLETDLGGQLAAAAAVLLAAPLTAVRRASESPFVVGASAAAYRGIAFADPATLERGGQVTVAALCTHGVITEGEPELVETHAVGGSDPQALLSLVAGAETAADDHPIARAVLRHCERAGLALASVRRATFLPGRGVTAVAPSGEELVVGNRQLLLAEGVSVAVADTPARRAEARGQTALFVGLDGRVRGVLAFRDEDRRGARAAVQRLIDLGIEVVLLSGDHRGTVEALAKTLDIGHVKAELLPHEQGAEVKRLRDTGGTVAVIGRPGRDTGALGAADVPVVLGAAGGPAGEGAVALTSEDVRDGAAALWLAHATRREARRGTLAAALAGGLGVLLAATGLLAPGLAALWSLAVAAYALPTASRVLHRIALRLPTRG
ncbi:MAG: HAD family hydrolase [Sandaracinaceae bacterium]